MQFMEVKFLKILCTNNTTDLKWSRITIRWVEWQISNTKVMQMWPKFARSGHKISLWWPNRQQMNLTWIGSVYSEIRFGNVGCVWNICVTHSDWGPDGDKETACCFSLCMINTRNRPHIQDYYWGGIWNLHLWSRDKTAVLWMVHWCITLRY
jgi:hypothetical protein